jgi:large subunit ribosomal protein L13
MRISAKTYSQKPSEVTRRWILIDAADAPLGRVSTVIAKYLIGKYKTTYTPHIDAGDYVVVINAAKLVVTGDKETGKVYYSHSGYPGGISDETLAERREKYPERIIEAAVKGMLPRNKLSEERLKRLRVFAGSEHTHSAQTPEKVEVK